MEARYKAGEFAGLEISMALRESKYAVQRTMVVARRLRADTPDAWDAWLAGDITFDKAERISRTLGRLVRDNSKGSYSPGRVGVGPDPRGARTPP